jgi:hypothetical protein
MTVDRGIGGGNLKPAAVHYRQGKYRMPARDGQRTSKRRANQVQSRSNPPRRQCLCVIPPAQKTLYDKPLANRDNVASARLRPLLENSIQLRSQQEPKFAVLPGANSPKVCAGGKCGETVGRNTRIVHPFMLPLRGVQFWTRVDGRESDGFAEFGFRSSDWLRADSR